MRRSLQGVARIGLIFLVALTRAIDGSAEPGQATSGGIQIQAGQTYDLKGFINDRGPRSEPKYWLDSARPGTARASGAWEVRLVDGAYPRSLRSIYEEYSSENPVVMKGTGMASGELSVDLMLPGFIPFVPVPEHVRSATVEDGILKIVVSVNRGIQREKLYLRTGTIYLTTPMKASFWVECPDPRQPFGTGGDVQYTFTLDLRTILHMKPPCMISVRSGVAGTVTTGWASSR